MGTNDAFSFTRRALLSVFGGLSVMAGAMCTNAEDKARRWTRIEEIENEYRRLLSLRQQERKQFYKSSDTHAYWQGPNGRRIIALVPAVIPYLILELRKGDFFFNVPLELITGIDVSNRRDMSEQEKSGLWLKWWNGRYSDKIR